MELTILTILTFGASIVGTLTGFGSSTVMVPVVALFYPLPVVLLFVGIIHLFNDFWKIILFRQGINWKLLLGFGVPGIIASFIGASMALSAPEEIMTKILGIVLLGYVFLIVFEPRFRLPHTFFATGAGGALSGFMAGIFGIGGPVRGMFLSAFNFKKHTYLFTAGATAVFVDLSRIATYAAGDVRLEGVLLWGLLVFIPVSFAGAEVAKKFVDRISQKTFRLLVSLFLFLVGVTLLVD